MNKSYREKNWIIRNEKRILKAVNTRRKAKCENPLMELPSVIEKKLSENAEIIFKNRMMIAREKAYKNRMQKIKDVNPERPVRK